MNMVNQSPQTFEPYTTSCGIPFPAGCRSANKNAGIMECREVMTKQPNLNKGFLPKLPKLPLFLIN